VKYFLTVNGEAHEVELLEHLGELDVRFDGQRVAARYEEVDSLGQVALFLAGEGADRSYAISIEGDTESAIVGVAGRVYRVSIEDERERAARAARRAGGGADAEVKSVMPGVVVKLCVAAGERVEKGQPLLILEAMKMQNEIRAPMSGRVQGLFVCEGAAVGTGARLALLAPESDSPA
jgi:biotin carboxyl carrier protein